MCTGEGECHSACVILLSQVREPRHWVSGMYVCVCMYVCMYVWEFLTNDMHCLTPAGLESCSRRKSNNFFAFYPFAMTSSRRKWTERWTWPDAFIHTYFAWIQLSLPHIQNTYRKWNSFRLHYFRSSCLPLTRTTRRWCARRDISVSNLRTSEMVH